jgi:hypothetical protein
MSYQRRGKMGKMILAIGLLSLVSGAMLLFVPQRLVKMGRAIDRSVITIDKQVSKYHVGVGVCLILASVFLFYYGYYLRWH